MQSRYNRLNEYYINKFGGRVLKICVDGSFSCPNRDGKKGTGGCIFCSSRGSGDLIEYQDIPTQIKEYLLSYKGQRANKFIVYFQNFTNTYDDLSSLKKKYDSALIDERIVGLEIATRCDCIDEEVCKLISSYSDKYYVCVELGLQSANEKTHLSINQLITNDEFIKAVDLLNKYHINIVIHMMVGLPGESHKDIVNTVKFLNTLKYNGLKIHSTYVLKNTLLEKLYLEGKYQPLTYDEYMEELEYIITHIPENIVLHRINGDPPKDLLVAPLWMSHKKWVMNRLDKDLKDYNLTQGCLLDGRRKMKALVTGASNGIGKEMAYYLASLHHDLVLVARSEDKLNQIKEDIQSKYSVKVDTFVGDLSFLEVCKNLTDQVKDIDILINNAGFGKVGDFEKISLDEELKMIDLNIKALHYLTKVYYQRFIKSKTQKYILNVGSIASFLTGPKMLTYYGTKNYVLELSNALRYEAKVNNFKVNVSCLCPGPTKTGFDDVANVTFSLKGDNAKMVAKKGIDGMFKNKAIIMPTIKLYLAIFFIRFLPRSLLLKLCYNSQNAKTK